MQSPSVLILVKNEQYFLPYVLAQLLNGDGTPKFDSFVIYDVGSTDKTREVINWFTSRVGNSADMLVRYLPHAPKEVQGTFRNSMIVEGGRSTYLILDGDELYTDADMAQISKYAHDLRTKNLIEDPEIRFGVFKRVEMSPDLTRRYNQERSHHRLYTSDAFWTGTHPGEVPAYDQNERSEIYYPARVWHFHNTIRSPQEQDALLRLERKNKKTYHPGDTSPFDLLAELPILQKPIENFPVSPSLAALQAKSRDKHAT